MRARIATADLDMADTHLPKGSMVIVLLGDANRDPDVFRSPNHFDIHLSGAWQMGLGTTV